MTKNFTLLFALFTFIFQSNAWSDEITINQLIDLAVSKSKQIDAAKSYSKSKEKNSNQVTVWDNPTMQIGVDQRKNSVARGSTNFTSVGISQKFYAPGTYDARRELSDVDVKIANIYQDATTLTLKHDIFKKIYLYLSFVEKVKHTKERLQRFKAIHTFLKSRPFASPQKNAEANIVNNKLGILQKDLLYLQLTKDNLWEDLNLYFKLQSTPIIKAKWYEKGADYSLGELLTKLQDANQDLKLQKLSVMRAEKRVSLSQKEALPYFNLATSYSAGRGFEPEKNYGVGISIPLPIFNRNTSTIAADRYLQDSELSKLDFTQDQLSQSLKQVLLKYQNSQNTILNFPVSGILDLERKMKKIDNDFNKGQVDLVTYIEADSQHSQNLETIFDSQINYVDNLSAILEMIGNDPVLLEK